jgi:hypothetical protein
MVCDAVWTDFDNDCWQDLVLAEEWMPVTFLKNDHGQFKDIRRWLSFAAVMEDI